MKLDPIVVIAGDIEQMEIIQESVSALEIQRPLLYVDSGAAIMGHLSNETIAPFLRY